MEPFIGSRKSNLPHLHFFDDVTFASTSGSQDLRPVLELHLAGERDVRVAAPGLGGNVLLRAQQVKASLVTNLGTY